MTRRGRPPDPGLRERLLGAATASFLREGFAASSRDEISRDASVSKGAMFHLFSTKRGLIVATLERWAAGLPTPMHTGDLEAGTRALAHVEHVAVACSAPDAPLGCLLGAAATELADDAEIRALVHRGLDDWANQLVVLLERARPFGAGWSATDAGRHFVAVYEGAQMLARVSGDRAVVTSHLALYHAWLRALLRVGR